MELIAKNFLEEGIRMGSLRHGIDKEHIGVNIEIMHEFHWAQVARDSLVHNRMEFTES